MSAFVMRAARLLSILITLQLRGRVSARELARQFEVSKRTIYRDVEELSGAGVPVYAEHGASGGFALLEGWQTQLTGMTAREAEALAFAQIPGAAVELGLGSEASAARLKFLASLPAPSSDSARRVADRFHLDPTPWHRRPSALQPSLRALAEAVWESRRIRIQYESWKGVSMRTVEPLGIVLKAGEWYFLAHRQGRPAIHKLGNVQRLTLLAEGFDRPAGFDLAASWRESVLAFESGLRQGEARLRVKASALSRLDRLNADMSEPILKVTPDAHGVREATVPYESITHAAGLLIGFGDDVEVLAPQTLREEIKRRARDLVALYSL
jgi:predicted DNA-binding transcriptional regulator YafY